MVTIAIGHPFSHHHQNIWNSQFKHTLSYVCQQRNAQTFPLQTTISQSSPLMEITFSKGHLDLYHRALLKCIFLLVSKANIPKNRVCRYSKPRDIIKSWVILLPCLATGVWGLTWQASLVLVNVPQTLTKPFTTVMIITQQTAWNTTINVCTGHWSVGQLTWAITSCRQWSLYGREFPGFPERRIF